MRKLLEAAQDAHSANWGIVCDIARVVLLTLGNRSTANASTKSASFWVALLSHAHNAANGRDRRRAGTKAAAALIENDDDNDDDDDANDENDDDDEVDKSKTTAFATVLATQEDVTALAKRLSTTGRDLLKSLATDLTTALSNLADKELDKAAVYRLAFLQLQTKWAPNAATKDREAVTIIAPTPRDEETQYHKDWETERKRFVAAANFDDPTVGSTYADLLAREPARGYEHCHSRIRAQKHRAAAPAATSSTPATRRMRVDGVCLLINFLYL